MVAVITAVLAGSTAAMQAILIFDHSLAAAVISGTLVALPTMIAMIRYQDGAGERAADEQLRPRRGLTGATRRPVRSEAIAFARGGHLPMRDEQDGGGDVLHDVLPSAVVGEVDLAGGVVDLELVCAQLDRSWPPRCRRTERRSRRCTGRRFVCPRCTLQDPMAGGRTFPDPPE